MLSLLLLCCALAAAQPCPIPSARPEARKFVSAAVDSFIEALLPRFQDPNLAALFQSEPLWQRPLLSGAPLPQERENSGTQGCPQALSSIYSAQGIESSFGSLSVLLMLLPQPCS